MPREEARVEHDAELDGRYMSSALSSDAALALFDEDFIWGFFLDAGRFGVLRLDFIVSGCGSTLLPIPVSDWLFCIVVLGAHGVLGDEFQQGTLLRKNCARQAC